MSIYEKTNKKPHPAYIEDLTEKMHFFLQINFSSFVGYFDFLYTYFFKRGIF